MKKVHVRGDTFRDLLKRWNLTDDGNRVMTAMDNIVVDGCDGNEIYVDEGDLIQAVPKCFK